VDEFKVWDEINGSEEFADQDGRGVGEPARQGPCVRSGVVSSKAKRWDPFPRNDPLKTGPGSRKMSKGNTEFKKHGLSAQDISHAKRLVKLARDDDSVSMDIECFEIFDVARVLKNYRERYEKAEAELARGREIAKAYCFADAGEDQAELDALFEFADPEAAKAHEDQLRVFEETRGARQRANAAVLGDEGE